MYSYDVFYITNIGLVSGPWKDFACLDVMRFQMLIN